jgi:nitrate ABC transporter ATP-binding subunit
MSSYLEFENVSKVYPTPKGPFVVLDGFDLQIEKGEFVSIIGHSGCGKSTALMMAAGLNNVTSGYIFLAARQIVSPGPDRGVVFQSPSLFPWMTALDNVMLGVNKVYFHGTKKQREDICKYYLTRVGLGDALYKKASELSNGMKQRVGLARAFALKPKLLLLDEPFGMLDSLTRAELQEVLLEIWQREHITTVMVTHDVDEAIFLSDRVVMMTNGPAAKVGDIMPVHLPRPRNRKDVIDHPDYYHLRGRLMDFLEGNHKIGPAKASAVTEDSSSNSPKSRLVSKSLNTTNV